ncbi:DNA translocase FtsK [Christensenellaceae bacterium OttesenSCG-928-M15]|nr:DNA translocase FtsK [Christensenellaceae bacterium OttesenSCG-928-M15]
MAKKSARAQKREAAIQKRKEIQGVIMISLGVFLAICVYFEAIGIVGQAVTDVLFGLVGIFAYALPPVLVAGGILLIAYALKEPLRGRMALIILGVFFVITLIHVAVKHTLDDTTFFKYVGDAYAYGKTLYKGGGAIGALLCFPLLHLIGQAGAYIFLITGILVVILLVTRISLRTAGQKVGTRVKESIAIASERHQARRQQLYIEDLRDDTDEKPMFAGEKKQPAKNPVRKQAADPDISYLPTEGAIRRKPKKRPLEETFLEELPLSADEAPDNTHEDVFFPDEPGDEPSIQLYERPSAQEEEFEATPLHTPGVTVRDLKEQNRTTEAVMLPDPEPDDFAAPMPHDSLPPAPSKSESDDMPPWAKEEEDPAPPHFDGETQERPPYTPPSFSLLNPPQASYGRKNSESPSATGKLLIETLESFNVKARIVNIAVGPVLTRFELAPAPGVRVNKFVALADDIALALAAPRVRIEAPIPGKAAIGIEVPNKDAVTVVLREVIETNEFKNASSSITMAIGKDLAGKPIIADLSKMPHLLIAGATGSGKSVCIDDIILSLIYKSTPDELQLILVDPKKVSMTAYKDLPHLKIPVVVEPQLAAGAIASGVKEMMVRYKNFADVGARDLQSFNDMQEDEKNKLPKLVIIIDELADLMLVAPDTVEDSICRIAQLGRAAGIHLVVATQSPRADIITGLIKANIPSRISLMVSSALESRIILDQSGAEKLLGRGDMLFHPNGAGKPIRAQAAFVSEEELERIKNHFKSQSLVPEFDAQMIEDMEAAGQDNTKKEKDNGQHEDELLPEAVRIVLDSGQASISMIQRRLRVGYARAARLIDIMEQKGYVGPSEGAKPRKLYITRLKYEQIFGDIADMIENVPKGECDEQSE